MPETTIWICPVCGQSLTEFDKTLKCPKNHSFDKARSGYVHLLPVRQKHARLPGDNPGMVRARRDFLNRNYYQPLRTALCRTAELHQPGVLLDAGCGEGYYTGEISRTLGTGASCYGIDISKTAADFAARQDKQTRYAVGSVFHLPVAGASCDMLTSVFAPFCGTEFLRVLKPEGIFVMVIPAARHLWELKQAVYDRPYENQVRDYALEHFRFLEKINCNQKIFLETNQDIQNLFAMTPYAYRTSAHERERLQALQNLEVRTEFEILIYQKEA